MPWYLLLSIQFQPFPREQKQKKCPKWAENRKTEVPPNIVSNHGKNGFGLTKLQRNGRQLRRPLGFEGETPACLRSSAGFSGANSRLTMCFLNFLLPLKAVHQRGFIFILTDWRNLGFETSWLNRLLRCFRKSLRRLGLIFRLLKVYIWARKLVCICRNVLIWMRHNKYTIIFDEPNKRWVTCIQNKLQRCAV